MRACTCPDPHSSSASLSSSAQYNANVFDKLQFDCGTRILRVFTGGTPVPLKLNQYHSAP